MLAEEGGRGFKLPSSCLTAVNLTWGWLWENKRVRQEHAQEKDAFCYRLFMKT